MFKGFGVFIKFGIVLLLSLVVTSIITSIVNGIFTGPVEATIVSFEEDFKYVQTDSGNRRMSARVGRLYPVYEFEVDGQLFSKADSKPKQIDDEIGDVVNVYYDKNDPSNAILRYSVLRSVRVVLFIANIAYWLALFIFLKKFDFTMWDDLYNKNIIIKSED